MPSGKVRQSLGPSKMREGFQSKVVAPRNPKLVRVEEKAVTLTPSAFLREMSLTTEQKLMSTHEMRPPQIIELLDMSETSHQKFSSVDLEQSLFQPFPSEVVFQNYAPCETYEIPLILRNNDKIPRLVKVILESSPYFRVISPNDMGHKVAPGMASTFRILFTPEENKDYIHQVICITEREKFIVPIRGIGARAILDFPDQLYFSTCPVKYSTQKTLLVCNIGNRKAHYTMSIQSPFSVEPCTGTLDIGETMQLTVEFHPLEIGDHCKDLIVHYDTGEDIHISLYGAATDVNVRLDKNSVMIEKTYITLANQRSVIIHNRSDIIAHFQWKVFVTQEEEERQKLRLSRQLQTQEENGTDQFLEECNADPTLREHISSLSHTFQNHRKMVQGDSMLFFDNIFTVEPMEGDVWPQATAEINVIFKPREAKVYHRTIYCDISGRETRLPLRIKGEGVGPKLLFSFDHLDIGKVFVGSTHCYEAILSNKGAIDALFILIPPSTALGTCFTLDPKEGIILPGGLQSIRISFSSTILGEFSEEFKFSVHGAPEPVKLTIRGCVIGPTFHFNVSSLNFGDVPFGFPRSLSCCLSNTSLVPMTFNLRIPGDGPGDPSVTSFVQILDITRTSWRKRAQGTAKPKEFSITPSSGTIRSHGLLDIEVTLCSNTVKKYEMALVVDVAGIGEEVLALLITARCVVPPLRVVNPVLKFGRCFLKFPYQQMVMLVNDTELPGCYGVLPQEYEEKPPVLYSSPRPCGIIQPRSTVEIPLTLATQVTGQQDTVASIAVFGNEESHLKIHLVTIGEGPVVHVDPAQIDFGNIRVLKDAFRTLHLSNQTVIPAPFWAQMARSHSLWRIEPSEGVVPPEGDVFLTLIANLDDTVKFQDQVNLFIQNSSTYMIPVQAAGIGTTIITDKPFAPALNVGPHFSLDPCCYRFKITNRGRRTHQLYWTTEGFPPFRQHNHFLANGNAKGKNSPQRPEMTSPVFKLHPLRMELIPGKTMDMVLEGSSDTPKVVKERLVCHAIIGKQSGKERIMKVDVTCEFIAPILHLSSKEITFRVEKHPSDVLTSQYEPLILKNVSSLPLNILLSLQAPFFLCDTDQQKLPAETQPRTLETGEELHLSIGFDPFYRKDLNTRVAEEILTIQYLEHPHEDQVTLRGEVHFPNLHFQTMDLDFGCILNDTEVVRYIDMTNCSPLLVKYHWSFVMDSYGNQIRFIPARYKSHIEPEPTYEQESPQELPAASEQTDCNISVRNSREMDLEKHTNRLSVQRTPMDRNNSPKIKMLMRGADEEVEGVSLIQSPAELQESLWLMESEDLTTGVEEVFDILPLYGMLQPNESQQVSFTFYGHADIVARAKAQCEVEGGPTYEIMLSGEASVISYAFDIKEIDYGLQLFDHISEAAITLCNTGRVGFGYTVLNTNQASADNPPPGVPLILPATGFIESGKKQVLKVYYLPGVPEIFQRTFQIQVAHLEPESITLKGEGTFPRICLDLPRNIKGNEKYEKILKKVKEKIEREIQRNETLGHPDAMGSEPSLDQSGAMFDPWLQMEVEQLLIQEHALEQQKAIVFGRTEDSTLSQHARRKLVKAQLPEYILDFGYIILGNIRSHIVKITNTSQFPVSFHADRRALHDTGFSIELDRVKNLPYCETETFEVRFDPRSANLPLGDVEVLLPIKVVAGPTFNICLRAKVTMPSLCISTNKLEFSSVQCGQCQVETIQLHNQQQVACEWFVTSNERIKKVDKHLPASLRRKLHQELKLKPRIFEMIPASGMLAPGERLNVQVKFAPAEEKFYSNHLTMHISQSCDQLVLLVSGSGLEPLLEFVPSVLELGPLLPYGVGDEAEVIVKNPCNFPIEFYSLEFDQQYLTEERILQLMKGYDSHNILLLPPRIPGEKLPPELLEYYKDQKRILDEQTKAKMMEAMSQENDDEENLSLSENRVKRIPSGTMHTGSTCTNIFPSISVFEESRSDKMESKFEHEEEEEEEEEGPEKGQGPEYQQSIDGSCKEAVGELDNNPVSRAIARHLGIDISPEGHAAKNRRGIVLIIYGAPLTGKTTAAVTLAKHYSAACLSIDSVVLEALSDRSSSTGLRARELCIRAAIEQAHRESEEAAGQSSEGSGGQTALGTKLSVEALAKHTSEGSQQSSETKTGPQSVTSRGYRGSTATGRGKSEGHVSQAQKQQHQSDQTGSQVPTSPIPSAPVQRRLSISASMAGESGMMSCVFPEELLVEILSERMQLSDCYRGAVFDGLETLFARSMPSALLCLLKAINNRRYIYVVNLSQDYVAMKAREKAKKEQEEQEKKEAIAREKARLQEMDEEEYDALTEEQKIQFDNELLQTLRERKKRELEKLARELEEKRYQQELERMREEEEMRKKTKRWKRDSGKDKDEAVGKKSQLGSKQVASITTTNKSDLRLNEGLERKVSVRERPDSMAYDKEDKKRRSKQTLSDPLPLVLIPPAIPEQVETEKEAVSDSEKNLTQRFKAYEAVQKEIVQILSLWDRVQGVLLPVPGLEETQHEAEDQRQAPSGRKGRKDRERERQERLEKERVERERLEKERAEKERLEKLKVLEESKVSGLEGEGAEGADNIQDGRKDVGVPCLEFQVLNSEESSGKRILESGKLPEVEQILDGLGLGPSGPPIPPTAFFSVIPYPEKRMAPVAGGALKHFTFVVPEETNMDEEKKDAEGSADASVAVPAVKGEQITPTRGRQKKDKVEPSREAQKDKRSTVRKKVLQGPVPGALAPLSELDQSNLVGEQSQEKIVRLGTFRWTVPALGEVVLKIHFSSTMAGQFDQTLNFEILGTRRQYQLHCRGICTYPTICQDPRVVFPHRRKCAKPNDVIVKQYVMSTGVFHFGPLLCGKSRDRYKALRYPNNSEKITILNISPLEAEVFFCFQHDIKANTYLLDPPTMILKPNEKQELSIWAYPTAPGIFDDSIVCCIKENPEPVVFRICCHGVRPELELDRKQLHFEKLLLHRKDTKRLFLRNASPMPVAWRLSGLENLGDDFSVSQDQGTIGPRSEYCLQLHFKASKPLSIKKIIRLEVSDVENILGVVQYENIQVIAESYDVALDISFPKGTDGGLDFGIIRVLDEAKQTLSLKNKGKYEIGYSLTLEACEDNMPNLNSVFSIQPQKGILAAMDRPTQIQITFRSKKEVKIEDKPILHCQVIEPSVCEGGETIASIPVKVSVSSLFTKYSISPASLINFGSMMNGTRKTCSFTLENKGTLDFKYFIGKLIRDVPIPPKKGPSHIKHSRSRDSETLSKIPPVGKQSKRTESLQKDINLVVQARFTLSMFTVYPGFGSIPAGGQQIITVDCLAEPVGKSEEYLAIDITDRDPDDNPGGIPYTLVAESCLPAFVVDDIGSIFEEHRICSNINLYQILETVEGGGVFVSDENKFIFSNVLVGHQATARFKIANVGRIPCDVVLAVKPVSSKAAARINDIFEVDPIRMCVPSRSHAFATVTFTPQTMQSYQCIFEAFIDGLPSLVAKSRNLTFDITGDGNLPRVTILRPILCNKRGNPLLLFKRLLLGCSERLPLVLKNSGVIPVQVMVDLLDGYGVFSLKARSSTHCVYVAQSEGDDSSREERKPHTASLVLQNGESAEFDVLFKPSLAQRVEGKIHLSVTDNQYEETCIQMVGEGYQDDITLDNIHGLVAENNEENAEGHLEEDVVEAAREDHIQFGDCHIGKAYQVTFTMTSRSKADVMRFEWPAASSLVFSPQIGHLHAGCAKDITVTLKSHVPVTFKMYMVKCKVCRITFQVPADQVPDWDDRLHTVKWVDAVRNQMTTRPTKKKVIETDPEPAHTVLEDSSRELELRLSGIVDYTQFKLETHLVQFKETLLFQTRVFKFQLSNKGTVALEYSWKVVMEDSRRAVSFPEELLPCSPEGEFPSAASTKIPCSRPASQQGSVLESVSSFMCAVADLPPFSLEPSSGLIPAGKKQQFLLKFSPSEVGEFEGRIFCSIPNLKPNHQSPTVTVKGKSLLPYCHFELEDSDYLTTNRCNPELRGLRGAALDPSTRVLEFASVGVHARNRRTFRLVNPTNSTYSFQWTCDQPADLREQPVFSCLTEMGQIQPEKKAEITFEFIPQHVGITESFWTFTIPEQNISVPFLLVGNTTEPSVSLDRSHLNYFSLLVGHEAHKTVHIINNENETFRFAFRDCSRYSEGYVNHLTVQPMDGCIPPLSRLPVTILFKPTLEGEVNFNLICDVKRKTQPLSLNVKAIGCSMNVCVRCEENDGSFTELSLQESNSVIFKEVEINESAHRNFCVLNTGKFSFSFSWEFSGTRVLQRYLSISPENGTVEAGERVHSQLSFHPLRTCIIKDMELKLKISNGPTFSCRLLASAVKPTIHFSCTKLNFGTCFIYCAGMPPATRTLTITNKEAKEISLDCLYTNTAHFEVSFRATVLSPGEKMEVPITFYPREAISYHDSIPFEISGVSQQTIEVLGKGTEMKLDILEPSSRVVKLGVLSVGQMMKKCVTIVNNSVAFLTFNLAFMFTVPELLDSKVLTLSPSSDITLKPKGGTCSVEVTFSPKCRIPRFTEEVMLECMGLLRSFFVVQGCCQGIEVTLDQDHIPFGAVVQRSQASRRILMQNTGDIGVRFKWDIKSFEPDFSISPVEGYISPGMEVPFEVTFHPCELNPDIHYENLQCFIHGSEALKLTLTGYCVAVPMTKEVMNFTCQVRGKHTQTIMLSNRSNQAWKLQPIVEGEQWKGPEFILVEAHQQNKPYEITYRPLTMNIESKKHQGSIFFPLPDGTGLLYLLQGTAEPPKSSGTIVREVPCKTTYTELLPISNWLTKPQRFHVIVDVIKPEKLDVTTMLKGLDYIEVPASSKKDYKLTFLSYKEGVFSAKVTFRNEGTQEYLFYLVTFKAIPSGPVSTIEMVTPVRQSTSSSIKVENPLSFLVTFTTDCKVPDINLPPQFVVPAQSEGTLVFEFQPLKVGEVSGRLVIQNSDLGSFQYDLNLKAIAAKPEKPLYFRAMLGSSQNITTKFINYTRQRTEYTSKIDCSDFHTDKIINAPPGSQGGTEVSVDVTYEPCQLGESRATLILSSPIGGEYNIPLFGVSVPPKPQGPFQIKAGSSTAIPFKNVFLQHTAFTYNVENPGFTVKAAETIRSKKSIFITVSFDGNPTGSKMPITSKLVVSCARASGMGAGISWVYYLKGITPEK
ncbi:hydrocephalus-inducing protein homolog isoform X2 [Carettochelys insculpta]|uniref:hydrocephalus-inducing protein homolog isoform X2 n=1 Tax=Carettochelys insculpta TaxID=44489 RepID=UPI003EBBCC2B